MPRTEWYCRAQRKITAAGDGCRYGASEGGIGIRTVVTVAGEAAEYSGDVIVQTNSYLAVGVIDSRDAPVPLQEELQPALLLIQRPGKPYS